MSYELPLLSYSMLQRELLFLKVQHHA